MQFFVPQVDASGQYNVNITSLLNADLTTVLFRVAASGDAYDAAQPTDGIANVGNRGCGWGGMRLSDVNLRLNGQLLFQFDGDDYDTVKLGQVISPLKGYTTTTPLTAQGQLAPYVKDICWYELNIARLRALCTESHLQNCPRYTNQTFALNFRIPTCYTNQSIYDDFESQSYILYVSYSYNGVFMCGGDGGQSMLITA